MKQINQRFLIRTDASVLIGSGHVMRCLVLADALQQQGGQVIFACRSQQGDLIDLIQKRGFDVIELAKPTTPTAPRFEADYESWLQLPWQQDCDDLLSKAKHIDWLIVDHYGIPKGWEQRACQKLDCRIMVIDDLVREHACDILIDQTYGRQLTEYRYQVNEACLLLVGSDYALLSPAFFQKRASLGNITRNPEHILVSMGGIDQPNATLAVLKALWPRRHILQVTVLLSHRAPHYQQVAEFSNENSDWIHHMDFCTDIASLMASHGLAIGAPGSTSWERACLGLPSVVVPLAENQKSICRNLTQVKAAVEVKLAQINNQLLNKLDVLHQKYKEYSGNCLALCDGIGVWRILALLNGTGVSFRHATTEDIELVYQWQSLPETRRFALNPALPTWPEHKAWMEEKLTREQDYFYLIQWQPKENKRISAGVVRLDHLKGEHFIVSIFLSPEHFGKGLAKSALTMLDIMHPDITINATVLAKNEASQALFIAAGYRRISAEDFMRDPVRSFEL